MYVWFSVLVTQCVLTSTNCLLKALLLGCMIPCRHQLLPDDDLGPLYDLLIDEPPEIRHAIGALVYDHLIAQKFNSQSGSKGRASFWAAS